MSEIAWEDLYAVKQSEILQLKSELEELKLSTIPKTPLNKPTVPIPIGIYSKNHIEKIRDIFFRYATVFSSNENLIDLSHFRLIFNELSLGCKDLNWTKAELIYHSVCQRSNIDFSKFIKLLKKISYQRFKSNDSLNKLAPMLKVPEKRMDLIDKNIQQWIEESKSITIKEVMSSYEELLRIMYAVYCCKDVKLQNRMGLKNLLEFCVDCKLVPAIVSNLEVARVFRAIEEVESLGYEDFLTSFACIGILGMLKIGITNPVHAIDKILVIISGNAEFIYTKKNQSSRWKNE